MVKDLIFCDAQKSSQECENTGVNTIESGISRRSDRRGERFGDEVESLGVVVKRVDPDTQKCGAEQDCEGLIVTSMI
jgi:hypothetical protein